jgi:kumamolisin
MAEQRKNMVLVPRTELRAAKGARIVGAADPEHRIQVTVYLRKSTKAAPALKALETALPKDRKYLNAAEIEAVYGADPDDITKVEAFAKEHGIAVLESHRVRRSVLLSGEVLRTDPRPAAPTPLNRQRRRPRPG